MTTTLRFGATLRGWPVALGVLVLVGLVGASLVFTGSPNRELYEAALRGDVERVRSLLRRAPTPDWRLPASFIASILDEGRTALHAASVADSVPCVDLLIDAGWTLEVKDSQGRTPVVDAAQANAAQTVTHLLDRGARGDTLPHAAGAESLVHAIVRNGNAQLLEAVLARGVPCDLPDGQGLSALHLAVGQARRGEDVFHLVRLLIQHGADVDRPFGPDRSIAATMRDLPALAPLVPR